MSGMGFALFVTTQTPSRAIRLKTSPPGSPSRGSREALPIVTLPFATSLMPTSVLPPPILKRVLPGNCLT